MKNKFRITKIAIYSLVGVLIAAILISLGVKNNIEHNIVRKDDGIRVVPYTVGGQIERKDAPLGAAVKYELDIASIDRDTKLVFQSAHSFVEVYIEGELVFEMKTSPVIRTVKTTGGHWNVVEILREDSGKKCTVVFVPVYEGFFRAVTGVYARLTSCCFCFSAQKQFA